jgi:tetraacyldisaccharide 4'-kinase
MEAIFRKLVSEQSQGRIPDLLRGTLSGCALAYRQGVSVRNWMYDIGLLSTCHANVPVVSVGNLSMGGTGKTPMVEYLCRRLMEAGKRVGILSRGYGASGGPNDEALVLRANLPQVPHWQGKNRVRLARQALREFAPDALVLDDGFQHRRLGRDLDIVLIDCTLPFGFGFLFPRGLLREPISSLKRADIIALSRTDQCTPETRREIERAIAQASGPKPWIEVTHQPVALITSDGQTQPPESLAGKSVFAFCGIGNPAAFWDSLQSLGGIVQFKLAFPDHHGYGADDILRVEAQVRAHPADLIVTTQKDLVKIRLRELAGRPVVALAIKAAVTDPNDHLGSRLRELFGHSPASKAA